MSGTSFTTAREVAQALGAKGSGPQWDADCPCGHKDAKGKLRIGPSAKWDLSLKCVDGTHEFQEIAQTIFDKHGLLIRGLRGHGGRRARSFDLSCDGRDLTGKVVGTQCRIGSGPSKRIWWVPTGVRQDALALYGAHRLPKDCGEVVLVEGPKAAEALFRAGIPAVAIWSAAWKPKKHPEALAFLRGMTVKLWPDNSDDGRLLMDKTRQALQTIAKSIAVVDWKDAPPKGDAADCPAELARKLVAQAKVLDERAEDNSTATNTTNTTSSGKVGIPFLPVIPAVLDDLVMDLRLFRLLLHVVRRCGKKGQGTYYENVEKTAKLLGAAKRDVLILRRRLVEAGVTEVTVAGSRGRGKVTTYALRPVREWRLDLLALKVSGGTGSRREKVSPDTFSGGDDLGVGRPEKVSPDTQEKVSPVTPEGNNVEGNNGSVSVGGKVVPIGGVQEREALQARTTAFLPTEPNTAVALEGDEEREAIMAEGASYHEWLGERLQVWKQAFREAEDFVSDIEDPEEKERALAWQIQWRLEIAGEIDADGNPIRRFGEDPYDEPADECEDEARAETEEEKRLAEAVVAELRGILNWRGQVTP